MPLRGRLAEYKTKTDLVYDYLEDALLNGDLKPGERINLDAMARDLGTSKIPVREALQRLANMGVITQSAHSGPVVVASSRLEMEGTFLVRNALEGLMAELAAPLITNEQLTLLDEIAERMRTALEAEEVRELSALNREYHMTIAAATGYRIFPELSYMLTLRVAHYRAETPTPMQSWQQVIDEHEAITAALRDRDPQAARMAATNHVNARLKAELSQKPEAAPPEE
jgi:DNA-binding GntR family transcriptional regulator